MKKYIINEHKNIILKSGNKLVKKYFLDYQIFHDCQICNIDYDLYKNKLIIDIQHDIFEVELNLKKLFYKIIFDRIFEVRFIYDNYVSSENFDDIDWSGYFHRRQKFSYLYGYFSKSNYQERTTKYLKGIAMRFKLTTDVGIDIVVDCLDIDIIEPKRIKKIDVASVFQDIYNP